MAASSSSSEIEVENHPFQDHNDAGPKVPYEAKQDKNGFYVRVDMPGVPYDGVKLFKYSDSRTVTFNGRAPVSVGCPCDSSDRVYGGYVVLDRDPAKIDIDMTVKNGCLRLFFPQAEGILHCFPSKRLPKNDSNDDQELDDTGSVIFWPCEGSSDEQFDHEPNVIIGRFAKMAAHPQNCRCCKGSWKCLFLVTDIKRHHYTNPYLMFGAQGVCEHKLVDEGTGKRMYLRIDMPGLEQEGAFVAKMKDSIALYEEQERCFVMLAGRAKKGHRLDGGIRVYMGCLVLLCTCCEIVADGLQVKDGVMRISLRKLLK